MCMRLYDTATTISQESGVMHCDISRMLLIYYHIHKNDPGKASAIPFLPTNKKEYWYEGL